MEVTKFEDFASKRLITIYERVIWKLAEFSNVNDYYMKVERTYTPNGCWYSLEYENPIQLYWFARWIEKFSYE